MGKFVHDGNTKVYWSTSIANKSAPTAAEMAAATVLTPQTTADGVNVTDTRNKAATPMLEDIFIPENAGTHSTAAVLTFTRDNVTDTAWDTFTHGTAGFLVIARGTEGDGTNAGDEVEVYPAESFDPTPLPTATNEHQKFEVELAITDKPDRNAVVAA